MKAIKFRYLLKAKSKVLEDRINPELVLAEISGAFASSIDNKVSYAKFQYSLETTILPKYFGVIKEKRGVRNYVYDINTVTANEKFNKPFRDQQKDFEDNIAILRTHFKNLEPTAKEVKEYLMLISLRSERKPKETFTILTFLKEHIKHLESLIDSERKDEVKNTTINSFRNLVPILTRYQEATKKTVTFENLNESTYRDIWFVVNEIRQGKITIESYTQKPKTPLATNTLKGYQTYFIQLCKKAQKKGIEIKLDITDTNLINAASKTHSAKTKAFLRETDLIKVIGYIPTSANLLLAKNYILLASQTGMRLQSMLEASNRKIELCDENGYNFHYVHTIQEKTSTECLTPLYSNALEIIQNNNNLFPDFNGIKLTNLNINIRKVLKAVDIDNNHLYSTHNLRSSFVTNLSLLGLPKTVISYVTHPDKIDRNTSVHIYDRRDMLDKSQMFTDEVNRVNKLKDSKIYKF